jgi:hypothetical protein
MTITPPPPISIPLEPVSVHHYNANYNTPLYAGESIIIDSDAITVGANGILYISFRIIAQSAGSTLSPYIQSSDGHRINLNVKEHQVADDLIFSDITGEMSDQGFSATWSGILVVPAGSVWSFGEDAGIQTTLNAYDIVYFTM